MKKSELKKILKPLIKECIKEAIFEEGVLSGLITEVAQGLSAPLENRPKTSLSVPPKSHNRNQDAIFEAKKQLSEVKTQLQNAAGLQGIFEGTSPLPQQPKSENSKYGALRDKDPADPGVNIDGLLKMTGGWSI